MEMTLYEYRDLLVSINSSFVSGIQWYFTLLSAYLVVAYFIGKKLTRFQVLAVSALYVPAVLAAGGMTVLIGHMTMKLNVEMYEIYGVGLVSEETLFGSIFNGVIFSAGVIVSLIFMWNIRRDG